MMKKRVIAMLGLVAMLGASNVGVYASDTVVKDEVNSSATFEFNNDDCETDTEEPTNPVDPEEPGTDVKPDPDDEDEGGETGHRGRLRIDYVSNFKFGSGTIEAGDQVFEAALPVVKGDNRPEIADENGKFKVPNYVQVSDLRGKAQGWTLSVKQNGQFKVAADADKYAGAELKGAVLSVENIKANTDNQSGVVDVAAEDDKIVFSPTGDFEQLLVAAPGKGVGTHVAHFGNYNDETEAQTAKDSVKLTIPKSAAKLEAAYKTTLTWQLSTTPENVNP